MRLISEDTAIAESDSAANLRLQIQNKKAADRGMDMGITSNNPAAINMKVGF